MILKSFLCAAICFAVFAANVSAITNFYPICDQVTLLGYPCEEHTVQTEDGFLLSVNRIPPKSPGAYPVYLQHGLLDSAITWVANANPYQNLACMLSDAGYDVWMNNARGNHYSVANVKYTDDDSMYWKMIDMDWMARYDLPAVIDHVLKNTSHATLSYVGHSQGGMMGFAGFGHWNKQYASKVDLFVGLAPACYVGHTTAFLVTLLADLDVATILKIFGMRDFLTNDWLLRKIAAVCGDLGPACPSLLDFIVGDGNPSNINQSQIDNILRYDPGGTSVNNMLHWAQEVRSGAFQTHDYGSEQNQAFYNQTSAPFYDLSQMAGPKTVIFSGTRDALADPDDVALIVEKVSSSVLVNSVVIPSYAHMDFVWGLDAYSVLYPQILTLIDQYKKNA